MRTVILGSISGSWLFLSGICWVILSPLSLKYRLAICGTSVSASNLESDELNGEDGEEIIAQDGIVEEYFAIDYGYCSLSMSFDGSYLADLKKKICDFVILWSLLLLHEWRRFSADKFSQVLNCANWPCNARLPFAWLMAVNSLCILIKSSILFGRIRIIVKLCYSIWEKLLDQNVLSYPRLINHIVAWSTRNPRKIMCGFSKDEMSWAWP